MSGSKLQFSSRKLSIGHDQVLFCSFFLWWNFKSFSVNFSMVVQFWMRKIPGNVLKLVWILRLCMDVTFPSSLLIPINTIYHHLRGMQFYSSTCSDHEWVESWKLAGLRLRMCQRSSPEDRVSAEIQKVVDDYCRKSSDSRWFSKAFNFLKARRYSRIFYVNTEKWASK